MSGKNRLEKKQKEESKINVTQEEIIINKQ